MLATYWKTAKLCFLTWLLTLLIGFTSAYFLAFHVRSKPLADRAVAPLHHPVLDLGTSSGMIAWIRCLAATVW